MMGFGLVFWILIVGAIVWVLNRSGGLARTAPPAESAKAVLDARLARGELTVEEYQKLRDALQ